ncbi:hypothetical protein EEL34_09955 [Muribaculaceae bacterium Isolate-039 (Harlan)]|nr:hypothetical protein EEL34_09955 [Muribaculaceae bacterium Isolate-039 (Harlan)]
MLYNNIYLKPTILAKAAKPKGGCRSAGGLRLVGDCGEDCWGGGDIPKQSNCRRRDIKKAGRKLSL